MDTPLSRHPPRVERAAAGRISGAGPRPLSYGSGSSIGNGRSGNGRSGNGNGRPDVGDGLGVVGSGSDVSLGVGAGVVGSGEFVVGDGDDVGSDVGSFVGVIVGVDRGNVRRAASSSASGNVRAGDGRGAGDEVASAVAVWLPGVAESGAPSQFCSLLVNRVVSLVSEGTPAPRDRLELAGASSDPAAVGACPWGRKRNHPAPAAAAPIPRTPTAAAATGSARR